MTEYVKMNKYKFVIILLGLLTLLILSKVSKSLLNHNSVEALALQRAEIISKKLIETEFKRKVFIQKDAVNHRGIASISSNSTSEVISSEEIVLEGKIGRDPWGKSFSYKKINNKLYIWSNGENQKLDSTIEQIEDNKNQQDDLLLISDIVL